MSGRQRLGIVLSLMWVVAGPLWLLIATNAQASRDYENCLRIVDNVVDGYADADGRERAYNRMSDRCQHTYLLSTTSLPQMIADEDTKKVLTFLVCGPLAVLWLLGAIAIVSRRWISRGFFSRT
jgi:hypothetical protein